MQKSQAVESLGQRRLMLPAWVKAALTANDRLKVFLTVLQAAARHAAHPNRDLPDLANEIAAAGLNAGWLNNAVATATRIDEDLLVPDFSRLVKALADDLGTMARPVLETTTAGAEPHPRVQHWLDWPNCQAGSPAITASSNAQSRSACSPGGPASGLYRARVPNSVAN